MHGGHVPGCRAMNQTGDDVNREEVEFRRNAAGDGEDGASPSRCRHCKRGVTLQHATVAGTLHVIREPLIGRIDFFD